MVESASGKSFRSRWRRAPGDPKNRKAPPERVGGLIGTMFARLGIAEKVERASVVAEWEDLVGAHIARVARPVSSETLATSIPTPADGPSLGIAPAGT